LQVAPALESVRKDLSLAAVQAKAELERLQTQAADARARGEAADFANIAMMGSVGMATNTAPSADSKDGTSAPPLTTEQKGKGKEVDPGPPLAEKITSQAQTLFHRLQASLPTQTAAPITTTTTNPDGTTTTTTTPAPASAARSLPTLASFQSTLSSHLSSNPHLTLDLPALRASLTTNFQKLQTDLHLADAEKLAEEYLKKSEGVLKEAGRYLQEAVKVVPPIDGGETGSGPAGGVSWDGSDVWTLPSPASKLGGSVIFSQTDAQVAALTGLSTKSVRAKRKDALLKQLRSDRAVVEVDPGKEDGEGVDEEVKSLWKKWVKEEVEAQGGITGDEWTARTWAELGPGGEGVEELKATRDALGESSFSLVHSCFGGGSREG